MKLTTEQIAETAHEANRAYCHSLGIIANCLGG